MANLRCSGKQLRVSNKYKVFLPLAQSKTSRRMKLMSSSKIMSPILLKLDSEKPEKGLQLLRKYFRGHWVNRSWRGMEEETGARHQE